MKFPIASTKTMDQSDSVMVLGSGPSLDNTRKIVQKWYQENNPLVIGAHYRFFLKSNYTIFDSPAKFRKAQGKIPGKYIIGDRIKRKSIKRKFLDRILRIHYSGDVLVEWSQSSFTLKPPKIPRSGAGWDSVLLATFCRPKKMFIAGFDGYEIRNGQMTVAHSMKSMKNVTPKRAIDKFTNKNKKARYILHEKKRKEMTYKIFAYMSQSLGIEVHICDQSRFHGVDKQKLKSQLGVKINGI